MTRTFRGAIASAGKPLSHLRASRCAAVGSLDTCHRPRGVDRALWHDLPEGAQALALSSVIPAFLSAGHVRLAASAGVVFATQTSYTVTAAGTG